jgi:hypothetical protein
MKVDKCSQNAIPFGGSVFESFPDMEKNLLGVGFALSLSG